MPLAAEDGPKGGLFLTQVGMTALHFAAAEGHAKVAALLVCHDADIEAADLNSHTPLWHAITCDRGLTVALLLEAGADPSTPNRILNSRHKLFLQPYVDNTAFLVTNMRAKARALLAQHKKPLCNTAAQAAVQAPPTQPTPAPPPTPPDASTATSTPFLPFKPAQPSLGLPNINTSASSPYPSSSSHADTPSPQTGHQSVFLPPPFHISRAPSAPPAPPGYHHHHLQNNDPSDPCAAGRSRGDQTQKQQVTSQHLSLHVPNTASPAIQSPTQASGSSGDVPQTKAKDPPYVFAAGEEACVICFEKPKTAGFQHGDSVHKCVCPDCAQLVMLQQQPCPVCRRPVDRVVLVYE
ncbi:MAG: hypothetical protein WDW36_008238 [Sanguina aurantia]